MTDSLAVDNMALTAEDSMILGLTPTTTTMLDPMVEQTTGMDQSTSTQTTNTVPPVPKENVSPVAKPVNNTSVAEKPATSVSKNQTIRLLLLRQVVQKRPPVNPVNIM